MDDPFYWFCRSLSEGALPDKFKRIPSMTGSIRNLMIATKYYHTLTLKTKILKRSCCQHAVIDALNLFAHKIIGLLAMSKDDRYREMKEIKEKAARTYLETGEL